MSQRLQLIGVKGIVAILDCCREFRDTNVVDLTRGGSGVSSASFSDTMVAYSCGPNGQAFDGKGDLGKVVGFVAC